MYAFLQLKTIFFFFAFGLQCSSGFVYTVYNYFCLVTGLFRVVLSTLTCCYSIIEFEVVWCFSFRCWELFFCKKSTLISIDIYHVQQSRFWPKILYRTPAVLSPLSVFMSLAGFLSFSSLRCQGEGGVWDHFFLNL